MIGSGSETLDPVANFQTQISCLVASVSGTFSLSSGDAFSIVLEILFTNCLYLSMVFGDTSGVSAGSYGEALMGSARTLGPNDFVCNTKGKSWKQQVIL